MSRGWHFARSRGLTAALRAPGRRSGRGMIVALVRNKYRGQK